MAIIITSAAACRGHTHIHTDTGTKLPNNIFHDHVACQRNVKHLLSTSSASKSDRLDLTCLNELVADLGKIANIVET